MSDWVKTGWVVEHGLSAGERVIVTGVNRIRPGITVKAVAAKPGKKAPAATKSES
jgi:membrane fusion protein (multidrug efflux system)